MTTGDSRLRAPAALVSLLIPTSLSGCGGASQDDARIALEEQFESFPPATRRDTTRLPEPLRGFCSYADRSRLASAVVEGTPVEFERLRGSRSAPPDAVRCVVRSWDEWERLSVWANMGGFDSVTPELFAHSMLILASMGEAPTSGSSVWAESVHSADGVVRVLIRSGSSGGDVLPAIVYPSDLIQLARTDAEVRFLER